MKFFFLLIAAALIYPGGNSKFSNSKDCNDQPQLNKDIVNFVKARIKKKVGTGECWDLASEALNSAGAKWDHQLKFGKKIDQKTGQCIYPGDIVQFEGVEVDYRIGNTIYHEDLAHHTAIIYEVKDKGDFIIAQQNTATHGRKVSLDPLNFKNITKGEYTVYRPEK